MAFIRNTSAYPDDEVRALIGFATRGVNMSRVCVNVKGTSQGWAGRAYDHNPAISNAPPSAKYLITLRLGDSPEDKNGPTNYYGETPNSAPPNRRFPFYECRCWRERLVSLAAHEAKHIDQFRHDRSKSEVKAERFAVKALERFRAEQPLRV